MKCLGLFVLGVVSLSCSYGHPATIHRIPTTYRKDKLWTPTTEVPKLIMTEGGQRVKRSPFIMAIQVTKPPGMFQMSLKRPYIFNMMNSITRSLFSTNLTELFRRGFSPFASNASTIPSSAFDAIRSRQEDLELFEK